MLTLSKSSTGTVQPRAAPLPELNRTKAEKKMREALRPTVKCYHRGDQALSMKVGILKWKEEVHLLLNRKLYNSKIESNLKSSHISK